MHRALENGRVGNTRAAQRVHCFFILGEMWTGRRMGNQPSKSKLTPLVLMLTWQNQFNTDDVEPVGDTFVKLQGGAPFYFEDFTSNAITTRMRIGGGDSVNAVMSRPLDDPKRIEGPPANDVEWEVAA